MTRQIKGMRQFSSKKRREIRALLIEKYGTDCQLCFKPINMTHTREDDSFSIDHIIPLADGGANTVDNMHPCHIACNEAKGSAKVPGRVRTNRHPRKLNHASVLAGIATVARAC